MPFTNVGYFSRPPSPALPPHDNESTTDDLSIAQELLNMQYKLPLPVPSGQHSIDNTFSNHVSFDGVDPDPQAGDSLGTSSHQIRLRREIRSSNTWSSSEEEHIAEQDDVGNRARFVIEYNKLAREHDIRDITTGDAEGLYDEYRDMSSKRESWFARKILRRTSSSQSFSTKPDRSLRHKRSISDLSIHLKMRRDKLKDKDLQELVILCGWSRFYLPAEYAASALTLPTCFRATAHYLTQYGTTTRGLFRIPGSQKTIAALYNHYCSMDEHSEVIAGTVRCPTLPDHIQYDVHDVASAFKRFLSGLPGGILGSLALFEALVSVQIQFHGHPELTRTKQSKVRARLIALAVLTTKSQYRRDLICAVFGLLSMIGRASETTAREDDRGHPLPTSDLMGYGSLGTIFGPLLVGDLLEDYTMRLVNPYGGLALMPVSPPKSRKERRRISDRSADQGSTLNTYVDKIKVAIGISEMLITHWRDIVRHIKNITMAKSLTSSQSLAVRTTKRISLRPSASEAFAIRQPPDWDGMYFNHDSPQKNVSPSPATRLDQDNSNVLVRKQRAKAVTKSNPRLSGSRSLSILSPMVEVPSKEIHSEDVRSPLGQDKLSNVSNPFCADINNSRPIHRPVPKVEWGPPSLVEHAEEDEQYRQGIQPSQAVAKSRLSGKIPVRIRRVEVQAYPALERKQGSIKKLVKPNTLGETPNNVTWATVDPRTAVAGTVSPKTSPVKSLEAIGKAYNVLDRKSTTKTQVFEPYTPDTIEQLPASDTPRVSSKSHGVDDVDHIFKDAPGDGMTRSEAEHCRLEVITPTRFSKRIFKTNDSRNQRPIPNTADLSTDHMLTLPGEEDPTSLSPPSEAGKAENESTPGEAGEEVVSSVTTDASENLSYPITVAARPTKPLPSVSQDSTISSGIIKRRPKATNSPGPRISALVAKFNHEPSTSNFPPQRSLLLSSIPRNSTEEEVLPDADKRKEQLVSPYTMNLKSPAKSFKSAQSDNTPTSLRLTIPSLRRPITDFSLNPTMEQTPRGISNGLVRNLAVTRRGPGAVEETSFTKVESLPASPMSSKSVADTPTKKPLRSSQRQQVLPHLDGVFSIMDDSCFTTDSTRQHSQMDDNEHGSNYVDATIPPSKSADFFDFVHAPSHFTDIFATFNSFSGTGSPRLDCSNAMLCNQVHTLQCQLYAKMEEAKSLRRQLESLQDYDIRTLSEQLMEAKRETQIWRMTAEKAQRQLQAFGRCQPRHLPQRHTMGRTTIFNDISGRSSTDYVVHLPATIEKLPKALERGFDGARSSIGSDSNESNNTVVQEIGHHLLSGSDYRAWEEHPSNVFEYAMREG